MTTTRPLRRPLLRNSSRLVAVSAGLALGLGACTVGPDYQPPRTGTPDAYVEDASDVGVRQGEEPGSLPETRWWATFGDATLDSLVERAAEGNQDLRVAIARVLEARALRGVAAAAGLPQIDANGTYQRERDSENLGGGGGFGSANDESRDFYQAGFDASWEIDVFGGVRRSVEAANADIGAAREGLRDVLVSLLSEVARNYVELRGLQARQALAAKNAELQADTLELSRSRFNAGLTSELDVSQAQAQLSTTLAVIPFFEAEIRRRVHALGVLLGTTPAALSEELTPLAPIPAPPRDIPVGLPSDLVRRRPDIRRAERVLAGETARVGVAVADLFPRFSITGSFGLRADSFGDFPDGDSRFWSVGPAVRWPLFQGGRIRASIQAQEYRAAGALAAYDAAVLNAFREVEDALISFTRSQTTRGHFADAVAANRRAVELSNDLYRTGLADFQRVLDSQRELTQSEDALANSESNVAANLVALYKALGGGWEDPIRTEEAAEESEGAGDGSNTQSTEGAEGEEDGWMRGKERGKER